MQQFGQEKNTEGEEGQADVAKRSLGRATWARPSRGRPGWRRRDAAQGLPPRDRVGQKGCEVQALADAENLDSGERKGNAPPHSDPGFFREQGDELRGVSLPRLPRSVRARPKALGSAGRLRQGRQTLDALQSERRAHGGARCPRSRRRRPLRLCVQGHYAGGSGPQLRGTVGGDPGSRGDPRLRPHPSLQPANGRCGSSDQNSSRGGLEGSF